MPDEQGSGNDRQREDENAVWARIVASFDEPAAGRTWPEAEELAEDPGGREGPGGDGAGQVDDGDAHGSGSGQSTGSGRSTGHSRDMEHSQETEHSRADGNDQTAGRRDHSRAGVDDTADRDGDQDGHQDGTNSGGGNTGSGARTVHGVLIPGSPAGPAAPGPRDYTPAEDEEHFVPPPPPPLPELDATTKFAWLGVLGGPLLLLVMVLIQQPVTWWMAVLGVGGFLGGAITLVARMKDGDDDEYDPSGGAVV